MMTSETLAGIGIGAFIMFMIFAIKDDIRIKKREKRKSERQVERYKKAMENLEKSTGKTLEENLKEWEEDNYK